MRLTLTCFTQWVNKRVLCDAFPLRRLQPSEAVTRRHDSREHQGAVVSALNNELILLNAVLLLFLVVYSISFDHLAYRRVFPFPTNRAPDPMAIRVRVDVILAAWSSMG